MKLDYITQIKVAAHNIIISQIESTVDIQRNTISKDNMSINVHMKVRKRQNDLEI